MTTDADPVYGSALDASGLDRQQCAVHMQRTVSRHIRSLDEETLTHLDRVLLPILLDLWPRDGCAWTRRCASGCDIS